MKFFAILILIYVVIAYLNKWWRERGKTTLRKWIHEEYFQDFKDASIPKAQSLIDKGEEIPSDTPTLFIIGGLRSQSRSIRFFNYFAELLSLGWVRLDTIVPEGYPLDLLLCFENISKNNHSILGKSTQFNIKYPNQPEPVRKWDISIPTLDSPGDIRIEHSRAFFTPEICGSHELRIKGLPGLRYAGPYGVGGRRYRISSPSGDWLLYFHVSSSYEYKVFIIAFVALAVAILSIFVSILGSV